MTSLQQIRSEYEVERYLELVTCDEIGVLPDCSTAGQSFQSRLELVLLRLAAYGALLVLTDGEQVHFVIGARKVCYDDPTSAVKFATKEISGLDATDTDFHTWLRLIQQTTKIDATTGPSSQHVFNSSGLSLRDPFSNRSNVSRPLNMSFFAGTPLQSNSGHNIGAVFVVDNARHSGLSSSEAECLVTTAKLFVEMLDLAQERSFYKRWKAMQSQLTSFVRSRSLRARMLEEPRTTKGKPSGPSNESLPRLTRLEETMEEPPEGLENVQGEENQRVAKAEVVHQRRIARREISDGILARKASNGKNNVPRSDYSETIYRKAFRLAAESLHEGLNADGVLFADGLIGFHGDEQPVAEPALELEQEQDAPKEVPARTDTNGSKHPQAENSHQPMGSTRTYTSAEYRKGVYVRRPTEVLGFSGDPNQPNLLAVSESISGLPDIDEGFFEDMMRRYPDGAIWYITDFVFVQVKDGTPSETIPPEDEARLRSAFPGIKQLMFKPVTDPISAKRLGACFVWKNQTSPLLSESSDLASLTAFLHEVESEIARYDTAAMVHQRETFVTSVSHELRTPLHGVLGAVQLLDLSDLDPMQQSLAEIINSCGSTLHETLTSVLSYAKINKLERRQTVRSYRNLTDTSLSPDEHRSPSTPDQDFTDLYICTNIAMLCEEIVGVLEAGRSFQRTTHGEPIVVCDIDYEHNWSYYTEPGSLRRIAVNLIGNALRYTEKGSVIVSLKASKLLKDDGSVNDSIFGQKLTLGINDTGRGMSKDFMENQLFVPFTQEDSTSSSGVGLGMSIVKSLVSLLGGEINVQSRANSGTNIDVRVPARKCDNPSDDKGFVTREFEHNIDKLRQRRLSVVIYGFPEFVRSSLEGYLRDWYGCILLDATEDAKPDIVLVDEGNKGVLDAVEKTACAYGLRAVLLSIVMVPSNMGKEMHTIQGYKKWKRIPRPLGPGNVAKGLLGCLQKLDELQGPEDVIVPDTHRDASEVDKQSEDLLSSNTIPASAQLPSWALEKLQLSDKPETSAPAPTPTSALPPELPAASRVVSQGALPSTPARLLKDVPKNPDPTKVSDLKLLIVDDNNMNLKLLGTFLRKNGYQLCEEARDGSEAVEKVQQSPEGFDIIFMDLSMPVMDGFEATRQIRILEKEQDVSTRKPVTIVALTGLASVSDEEKAFDAGVNLYYTKPVQFGKLRVLLQNLEDD